MYILCVYDRKSKKQNHFERVRRGYVINSKNKS